MERFEAGAFELIIIGGGHAGCEAAFAAVKLGVQTALFTISLDAVANLPCNPSIGGTAKGHLVREIDALGGQMGKLADRATIQSRMLNRGKGPAVYSLRTQVDRRKYHTLVKQEIEQQENLVLKQGEITDILVEDGKVNGVVTRLGAIYHAQAVIIASGTYLNAVIHIGDACYESGPDGILPANLLSESLQALDIPLRRFKTGTPARVHRRSIDFSKLLEQEGDEKPVPFSFETNPADIQNTEPCYIAYTNEATHDIIRANLHRSPMYRPDKIEGVGPRYCPSIEDKVVRFAEKNRHQIFVEPVGLDTDELYLAGVSTSLPEDVQDAFYRTIEGFEKLEIMRSAYAIEYDCVDPTALYPTLEFKNIRGLYGAGQFNGTSGYEEAAAQGLVAAVNAAHQIQEKEPFILERSSSYIGTLIDDLVTKGCNDPYRMMTSRSEYRLILRQDNADLRLMEIGYQIGLLPKARYDKMIHKKEQIEAEIVRFQNTNIPPSVALNQILIAKGSTPIQTGYKLADLVRRPQISYEDIRTFDPGDTGTLPEEVTEQVEIAINYEGYIKRQLAEVAEMKRQEGMELTPDTPYEQISGLRFEAQEKLAKARPLSISQASRISGVSPADISVLLVWLAHHRRAQKEEEK